jgi:hypothetical protein
VGTTKIYTMAAEGLFPKKVPLGGRSVGWIKSEVLQCNHAQIAAACVEQVQASAQILFSHDRHFFAEFSASRFSIRRSAANTSDRLTSALGILPSAGIRSLSR